MLPGRDETLRVNGRAWLTTEDAVLDGFTAELRRPKAAIGVEVVDAFVHCAKSFRRGQVWDPASWAPGRRAERSRAVDVPHRARRHAGAAGRQPRAGYARDLAAERASEQLMEESSLPFDSILADCLPYVRTAHGEVHAERLFFELYNAIFTFLDRELGEASVDRYWEHSGRTRSARCPHWWPSTGSTA